MNIGVRHVPLEKEGVLERLRAPLIVPDPLPDLPGLTSNAQVPVVAMVPQAYVLDPIPEVLPERGVPQPTPVLVRRHNFVISIGDHGAGTPARTNPISADLAMGRQHFHDENEWQDRAD